jgi:hypothetical protein
MVNSIAGLRSTLDTLARTTWTDIEEGRRLGIGMGEVGITDHNMLALRREHPSLLVHKHSGHEEVRTGADWEWWLRISDGWICLVFQAKVLSADGRYPGIAKGKTTGKPQVDLLLQNCLMRSERLQGAVWPLYCFYNSWQGNWPEGVQRYDGAYGYALLHEELQLYGCAAANAWRVRRILLDDGYSNRRTLRDSYLPISRPWSMIFPDPAESAAYGPRQIMTTLSSWMPGRRPLSPAPPLDDAGETEIGMARRRNRRDVYRDPTPIDTPPEYVLDLLQNGEVQPRRLRPLARRVVILPEMA